MLFWLKKRRTIEIITIKCTKKSFFRNNAFLVHFILMIFIFFSLCICKQSENSRSWNKCSKEYSYREVNSLVNAAKTAHSDYPFPYTVFTTAQNVLLVFEKLKLYLLQILYLFFSLKGSKLYWNVGHYNTVWIKKQFSTRKTVATRETFWADVVE